MALRSNVSFFRFDSALFFRKEYCELAGRYYPRNGVLQDAQQREAFIRRKGHRMRALKREVDLLARIRQIWESACTQAARSVNAAHVRAN